MYKSKCVLLTQPINLGGVTLQNRISVPPMCMFCAKSGVVQKFHMMHYSHLAMSGVGSIVIEATAVTPRGRISPNDLGLWSDECEKGLTELVSFMREINPKVKIFIQLAHAGMKASTEAYTGKSLTTSLGGWIPEAPSAIAFDENSQTPRELTIQECEALVTAFGEAARRAIRAGVDGIQVHAAHGYLIHEFLSPITNHRLDEYGGPLESRMKFAKDVINEVKKAINEAQRPVALGVRVSATDWACGGWDLDDTVTFAKIAKVYGCDFIDVSTGGLIANAQIPVAVGYQMKFAQEVKKRADIVTFAVGLVEKAREAEMLLQMGVADVIDVGRKAIDDPMWGWHAYRDLGVDIPADFSIPIQYRRCINVN